MVREEARERDSVGMEMVVIEVALAEMVGIWEA